MKPNPWTGGISVVRKWHFFKITGPVASPRVFQATTAWFWFCQFSFSKLSLNCCLFGRKLLFCILSFWIRIFVYNGATATCVVNSVIGSVLKQSVKLNFCGLRNLPVITKNVAHHHGYKDIRPFRSRLRIHLSIKKTLIITHSDDSINKQKVPVQYYFSLSKPKTLEIDSLIFNYSSSLNI